MGDNIWLPDRDASRTPMQWTPDRNAGFSTADPGKLYLPVVQSLVYNYSLVNVESQLAQSRSLLHWVRNVIHVRKAHPTFGLGTLHVLETRPRVGARVRARVRGLRARSSATSAEDVLCVFSFATTRRPSRSSAPEFAGRPLYDLFGGGEFPAFDDDGTVTLTLGTQCFYWLHLGAPVGLARVGVGASR